MNENAKTVAQLQLVFAIPHFLKTKTVGFSSLPLSTMRRFALFIGSLPLPRPPP